uniref:Uncharacterized protein n=1 Tax=Mimivirus LCMiAC01 TaxID=2506608 RepID=A0A481YYY0_9VIRU|nr:MAG: hypothetical protein LCMiAC01_00620 [Mimivirus LCMiAC01]
MTTQLSSNPLFAFLIGVLSFFPSIMPSIYYLIKRPSLDLYRKATLENKIYQMPIAYGILHIILFFLINKFMPEGYQNYLVLGVIIGLIYPTLGTVTKHARDVYGREDTPKNILSLYVSALILYVFVYGVIFNYIAKNIC